MAEGATGGRRRDLRVLAMVLAAYLCTAKGYLEASDTSFSLFTAESIVARGRLDIPEHGHPMYTYTTSDGRVYSKYGIGLALFYVPIVAASTALSRAVGLPSREIAGFLISFANLPFAIMTLALLARVLRLLGATGASTRLLTAGLGLGTLCWYYAVSDFSEAMQTALLLLAVYGVVRGSPASVAAGGLAFGYLLLVKMIHGAFLPFLLAYLLSRPGAPIRDRLRQAIRFGTPSLVALAALAWLNYARFGSPGESGYGEEAGLFYPSRLWRTIPGLLGSVDKGLFLFSPVLVLGVLGWRGFARRRPREAALFAAIAGVNLVLTGAWHAWGGGMCWGPRMLVPTIPLWLVPAVAWLDDRRSPRRFAAATAIAAASILLQLPGLLVKDQQIHHLRIDMLTDDERARMVPDYPAACILLRHKLAVGDEVYLASEFGSAGGRSIDMTPFKTFHGIDVWTEHLARQFRKPLIRLLPIAGLLTVLVLGVGVATTIRAEVRAWPTAPARWTGDPDLLN